MAHRPHSSASTVARHLILQRQHRWGLAFVGELVGRAGDHDDGRKRMWESVQRQPQLMDPPWCFVGQLPAWFVVELKRKRRRASLEMWGLRYVVGDGEEQVGGMEATRCSWFPSAQQRVQGHTGRGAPCPYIFPTAPTKEGALVSWWLVGVLSALTVYKVPKKYRTQTQTAAQGLLRPVRPAADSCHAFRIRPDESVFPSLSQL